MVRSNSISQSLISWLRLLLEYGQEPLWQYDSDGEVIDVGLPPEWEDCTELNALTLELSDRYDELFVDNDQEFLYVGFRSTRDRTSFQELADKFAEMVYAKNNGKYRIVNDLKIDDWHSSICR